MGRRNRRERNVFDPWEEALRELERGGEINYQPDIGEFLSRPVKVPPPKPEPVIGRTLVGALPYAVHIRINCVDGPVRLVRVENAFGPHDAADAAVAFLVANINAPSYDVTLITRDKHHWERFTLEEKKGSAAKIDRRTRSISGIPLV